MEATEKEEIYKLRLQGLGYKTIARELLLTVDTVKGYCKRHHLNGPMEESALCLQGMAVQRWTRRTGRLCADPVKQVFTANGQLFISAWWIGGEKRRKQEHKRACAKDA